jgi:hypothetical protein
LAIAADRDDRGGLPVAAITRVYTIGYVAEMLGDEEEDLLWDIAIAMDPEHGPLWVYGVRRGRGGSPHRLWC